jgi:hypothetical protein
MRYTLFCAVPATTSGCRSRSCGFFTFIDWAITGDRAMNHGAHQLAVG